MFVLICYQAVIVPVLFKNKQHTVDNYHQKSWCLFLTHHINQSI
ncbi:hypothetical protein PRUB_b0009 [Pseudoalteromonas rubra]|uniref:Uncharacterized protein n=1 Tax=Pseudoalteromonas rubra TaxID=43658 RepID=A0A8T0BYG2_9GAMM|nr:hypothetical protein PRUB_b0009 [Pseudoalteromonas rubra]